MALSLESQIVKLGFIEEQQTILDRPFPLVLIPADSKVNFVDLQEYFQSNHQNILKAASLYGAVLFKGFDIQNGEEWASVLYTSGLKEMNYVGGAAVRKLIVGTEGKIEDMQILTTNESPPSEPIPFHHELAQTPNPPSHICFFCQHNAAQGGSTPLLRSDFVYNWLLQNYPDFTKKIEDLGVRYIRTVPEEDDPSSAVGRSWKSMFHVKTRQDAEKAMEEGGFTWEWDHNGSGNCKVISKCLPAVITCSNKNKVFFNQVIAAYLGWVDKRNSIGSACTFGDNTPLPKQIIEHLSEFMKENQCAFKWMPGMFCIVDNTVAYHSRQSFQGRRRVLAAIAKDTKPVASIGTNLVLSSGNKMPQVGLGCWKISKDQTAQVTYDAIKTGYRCIDEACDYGNEKECGEGIKKALADGLCKREELWVTSKLWNTYHRKEHVKNACLRSLQDLGVDYLDLYLIHFPIALKFVPFETRYPPEWFYDPNAADRRMEEDETCSYRETWEAMEDLVREGLVKNIGMCNIGTGMLREVLSYAKIKPTVLQVEMHPYNTQEKLLRFCREKGIAVTAFSNLGASSYFELGMAAQNESCLEESVVKELANKYQKSPGQIVLRWGVQRGTAIIPKTTKSDRLKENFDVFSFRLTDEEMQQISNLNKNKRFNDPGHFCEVAFSTFYPIYE